MKNKAPKMCVLCAALSGQDATSVKPHKTMFRTRATPLRNGDIDVYRCGKCSTEWGVIYSDGKRTGEWKIIPANLPAT